MVKEEDIMGLFVFFWIFIFIPAMIFLSPDCKTAVFSLYVGIVFLLFMFLA